MPAVCSTNHLRDRCSRIKALRFVERCNADDYFKFCGVCLPASHLHSALLIAKLLGLHNPEDEKSCKKGLIKELHSSHKAINFFSRPLTIYQTPSKQSPPGMSSSSILLTGASGNVGFVILEQLLSSDHHVNAVLRSLSKSKSFFESQIPGCGFSPPSSPSPRLPA
jgi:hypothetical protein